MYVSLKKICTRSLTGAIIAIEAVACVMTLQKLTGHKLHSNINILCQHRQRFGHNIARATIVWAIWLHCNLRIPASLHEAGQLYRIMVSILEFIVNSLGQPHQN